MGLLTKEEKAQMFLGHGKVYEYVCDSKDCGHLIQPGELFIVLKWQKRTDGLTSLLGRIPSKVRCMDCERFLHPPPEVVKVKNAGRGAKKVSADIASTITIDAKLRRLILRLLKASPEGIPVKQLLLRLRKKKMVREMSAKVVKSTIKGMKKLKLIRRSKGNFMLPKEKKARKVNAKVKAK